MGTSLHTREVKAGEDSTTLDGELGGPVYPKCIQFIIKWAFILFVGQRITFYNSIAHLCILRLQLL